MINIVNLCIISESNSELSKNKQKKIMTKRSLPRCRQVTLKAVISVEMVCLSAMPTKVCSH